MPDFKTASMCISSDYCKGWNDAVREMPKWISVDERLPSDGKRVLVYAEARGEEPVMIVTYYSHNIYNSGMADWHEPWVGFFTAFDYNVTHWMPLPDAPEGD